MDMFFFVVHKIEDLFELLSWLLSWLLDIIQSLKIMVVF